MHTLRQTAPCVCTGKTKSTPETSVLGTILNPFSSTADQIGTVHQGNAMSKEEAAAAETKPAGNRQKALDRIGQILNKYKLIKAPSVIQDVVKHVYGDLSNDETKADKAFGLISKLINELVDNGAVNAFAFTNVSMPDGSSTPSIVTETLLVLPSFELVGYVPASSMNDGDGEMDPDDEDDGDDNDDEVRVIATDDVLNEIEINEVLSRHAEAYAIVPFDKKGKQKSVIVRHSAEAALGKFLSVVAEEEGSANLYAMVPVNLEIKTSIEKNEEAISETSVDAVEEETT